MLDILYQDDALVVCVKPFRVLSTDEPGGMPDLIREALGQPHAKVRAVHRLDQVVGGLMVYGLSAHAASELSRQIRENRFAKEYQAVIHWRPREDQGTFRDLLGRNEKTRKTYVTQTPAKGVQEAVLHYQLLDNRQGFSPGADSVGDGPDPPEPGRYPDPKDWQIALWSNHLSFTHPETGEAMDFRLPPPETEPWTLFQATGRN